MYYYYDPYNDICFKSDEPSIDYYDDLQLITKEQYYSLTTNNNIRNLIKYKETLTKLQEEKQREENTPYISRVESTTDMPCTLWIPVYSGNRTAAIDLNHEIGEINEEGFLEGYNGNCGTPYIILEVPKKFKKDSKYLDILETRMCKRLNKTDSYPKGRILKADDRIYDIIEEIAYINKNF